MNRIYKQIGYHALRDTNPWLDLYYHYTSDDFKRLELGELIIIHAQQYRTCYAIECCGVYKLGLSHHYATLCFDCIHNDIKKSTYQFVYKGKMVIKRYFYKLYQLKYFLVNDILYHIGLLYIHTLLS